MKTLTAVGACVIFFLGLLAVFNHALNVAHARECTQADRQQEVWLDCPHSSTVVRGEADTVEQPSARPSPPRVEPKTASRSRLVTVDPPVASGSLLEVTCYSQGSTTASGKHVREGMAAANSFRFGTVLDVEGYGRFVVEDRSAPGATDVDIYNASESYCRSFGRQHLHVAVVR